MPRIDINEPNNKTDWATVPSRTNKWDYTDVTVDLTDEDDESHNATGLACQVKVRGNYTADYAKKPFRLKFNKKQAMFGLNNGAKLKSWVLLADVKDASFSRNATAFFLGKTILGSDGYYCTDYRPVELYINGRFWGVYLLAEQQQINPSRVAIDDVTDREPEEGEEVYKGTDTGYLVEYDGYAYEEEQKEDGDPTFRISYHNDGALQTISGRRTQQLRDYMFAHGQIMNGFTIKSDILGPGQQSFIGNVFDKTYNLVYDAVYNNRFYQFNEDFAALVSADSSQSVEEVVGKAIDIDSFVDTYILNEIVCDYDINWSSFYFSADFSENGKKKIVMEAPWDFDSALACRDAAGDGKSFFAAESQNAWLLILQRQSWFQEKVKAKWAEMVENHVLSNAMHFLDAYRVNYFEDYYTKEYSRWGRSAGAGEWRREISSFNTQAQHSNYLYGWLAGRLNWLSTQWGDGEPVIYVEPEPEPNRMTQENYQLWAYKRRFEAEEASPTGGTVKTSDPDTSNGLYVGNLDGTAGIQFSFDVTASNDAKGYLTIDLSKRQNAGRVDEWYGFLINGEPYEGLPTDIPAIRGNERDYHAWAEVAAGGFPLKAGKNTIAIITKGYGTNIDYFDLYSPADLRQ